MFEQEMFAPVEGSSAKSFENAAELYRFKVHHKEGENTKPVDTWHSLLSDPTVNGESVAFDDMENRFGDRSDIFKKN